MVSPVSSKNNTQQASQTQKTTTSQSSTANQTAYKPPQQSQQSTSTQTGAAGSQGKNGASGKSGSYGASGGAATDSNAYNSAESSKSRRGGQSSDTGNTQAYGGGVESARGQQSSKNTSSQKDSSQTGNTQGGYQQNSVQQGGNQVGGQYGGLVGSLLGGQGGGLAKLAGSLPGMADMGAALGGYGAPQQSNDKGSATGYAPPATPQQSNDKGTVTGYVPPAAPPANDKTITPPPAAYNPPVAPANDKASTGAYAPPTNSGQTGQRTLPEQASDKARQASAYGMAKASEAQSKDTQKSVANSYGSQTNSGATDTAAKSQASQNQAYQSSPAENAQQDSGYGVEAAAEDTQTGKAEQKEAQQAQYAEEAKKQETAKEAQDAEKTKAAEEVQNVAKDAAASGDYASAAAAQKVADAAKTNPNITPETLRGMAKVFDGASDMFKTMAQKFTQQAAMFNGLSGVFKGFSGIFNSFADMMGGAAGAIGGAVGGAGGAAGGAGGAAGGAGGAGGAYGGGAGGTTDPGGAGGSTDPGGAGGTTPDVNRNIDFTKLSPEERSQLGMTNEERAIDHLWGRQVISKGFQDGSIYNNVLNNPQKFTPTEVALVKQWAETEKQLYGGINGKELDKAFFGLMQKISPDADPNKIQQYLNAPMRFSDGSELNIVSDLATLQKQTGLNADEQAALRLWGHEPLFNGGQIDGSILAYTIGNANSLDSDAQGKGGPGASIDGIAESMLKADLASDGVRNGDSLKFGFGQVLDKIYLGGDGLQAGEIDQNAQQVAQANGRTPEQIQQDTEKGMVQALSDSAKFVKDHPIISAAAVGGVAAATAVCPFLGAMGAGAAGIMAGQQMGKGG